MTGRAPRRYLVVANQTAADEAVVKAIKESMARGPALFRLVVPATHPRHQLTWAEGTASGLAHRRLIDALERLRAAGADIDGWVGAENPYHAIVDAMVQDRYDEVILSTFHPSISRWLKMDVASRVEANYQIPVRVVTSRRSPLTGKAV